MIYIIIFAASLLFLTLFVGLKAYQIAQNEGLQKQEKWYSIDMVHIRDNLFYAVRYHGRPVIRTLLYRLLSVYRKFTHTMRTTLRKTAQKLLHHYDEKHDPRPRKQSPFLDNIHQHKQTMDKSSLHDDAPRSE